MLADTKDGIEAWAVDAGFWYANACPDRQDTAVGPFPTAIQARDAAKSVAEALNA